MTEFRPGRFQILPPVVKNLIIINALIVLLQYVLIRTSFHIDLADYFGLHYWKSHYFRPWQFITHMFLHGSALSLNSAIGHLFSNMFALWIFGSILENVWGPKRFLMFYLICGVGAAMIHLGVVGYEFHVIEEAFRSYQANPTADQFSRFLQQQGIDAYRSPGLYEFKSAWESNPGNPAFVNESIKLLQMYLHGFNNPMTGMFQPGLFDEATVGASGAVFGILFAFGYLFPNTYLYLYFFVPVKAKYVVAVYALIELSSGIRNSAGDNVAHFAHLGGMLVAFILLRIWNKTRRDRFY